MDKLIKAGFKPTDIRGELFKSIFDPKKHKLKAHLIVMDWGEDESHLVENCVECNVLDIRNVVSYDTSSKFVKVQTICLIHVFDESVKKCFNNSDYVKTVYDNWFEISNDITEDDFNAIISKDKDGNAVGIVVNVELSSLINLQIKL